MPDPPQSERCAHCAGYRERKDQFRGVGSVDRVGVADLNRGCRTIGPEIDRQPLAQFARATRVSAAGGRCSRGGRFHSYEAPQG
jgi:hypothetical protein